MLPFVEFPNLYNQRNILILNVNLITLISNRIFKQHNAFKPTVLSANVSINYVIVQTYHEVMRM